MNYTIREIQSKDNEIVELIIQNCLIKFNGNRAVMNGFNAIFENDRNNRLFGTNRPLHYAEGGCFMLI